MLHCVSSMVICYLHCPSFLKGINVGRKVLFNFCNPCNFHTLTPLLTASEINKNSQVNYNELSKKSTSLILDYDKLNDTKYIESIEENMKRRKSLGDVKKIKLILEKLNNAKQSERDILEGELQEQLLLLPNSSCPEAVALGREPKVLQTFGRKPSLEKPHTLEKLSPHGVDMQWMGNFAGEKSYYLRGSMARLQHKLIRFTIGELLAEGFSLMSVPDIVSTEVLDCCGIAAAGERTLVYRLDPAGTGNVDGICLSGTGELGIAGWLRGRRLQQRQLPLKLCAVSRCYRAEAERTKENRGIFRVHGFTKVEMFGVTSAEDGESNALYQHIINVQQRLLEKLSLHFQVVLMPLSELGSPAHSKTDMEVWMAGRGRFAEVTSASNCTHYQAARLHTTYLDDSGKERVAHTVNGTAVAVPRCIMALCEAHQGIDSNVFLPKVLGVAEKRRPEQTQPNQIPPDGAQQRPQKLNKPKHLQKYEELKKQQEIIAEQNSLEMVASIDEKCSRRYLTQLKSLQKFL